MASAQAPPNTGALTLRVAFDVPSVYVLRGLVQEREPAFTGQSLVDLTATLSSGDGAVKRMALNLGWWSSYHTGASGTSGPSQLSHYEEDFFAMLNLRFGGNLDVDAGYRARTSPNRMFGTVNEAQLRVAHTGRFNPYGVLVFELGDESADGGRNKGSYAELGMAPRFAARGRATLSVPVRIGLSLQDYYETFGQDSRFGFFAVGGLVTWPLGTTGRFGAWHLRGSADVYALGDTPKMFNDGKGTKAVALIGVGITY